MKTGSAMVEFERLTWNCSEAKVPFPHHTFEGHSGCSRLAGIVSACAEGVEKVDGVTQRMIWIPPANKQKNVQPFNLLTNSLCQQLTIGDTFSTFSSHGLSGGGVSLGHALWLQSLLLFIIHSPCFALAVQDVNTQLCAPTLILLPHHHRVQLPEIVSPNKLFFMVFYQSRRVTDVF